MPKVSVIVPVYGVEKYIERCAKSLFEQTLDDIEYLFIDDCTPDKSIDILKEVLEKYPNRKYQVKIHKMDRNSGQAAVRKWGMQHAKGDYIIHCDSDDWADITMYEVMYKKAIEENADIVVCNYYETDGIKEKYVLDGDSHNPNYLFEYFQLWIRLTKKSLIDKIEYYPLGDMGEDRVYAVQTGFFARKIIRIKNALYYYYLREGSITRSFTQERALKNFKMRYENTLIIEKFLNKNNLYHNCYFIQLKMGALSWLEPFLNEQYILKVWRKSFPKLGKNIIKSKDISIKNKLKYCLIYSGIYTILKNIK